MDLCRRVHGAAAVFCTAVADGLVDSAVIETVIVGDFFSGGYLADGFDPDAAVLLAGFAVGVATVVDEHGHGVAVDDDLATPKSKEIGDGSALVGFVGMLFAEMGARVLGYANAFADGSGGVAPGGVDEGGADDKGHANVRCFS